MSITMIIIGMAVVTAIPRLLPFTLPVEKYLPGYIVTSLSFVPVAALTALVIPGIFHVGDTHWIGVTGGVTATALSLFPKNNLIATILITFIICFMVNTYFFSGT